MSRSITTACRGITQGQDEVANKVQNSGFSKELIDAIALRVIEAVRPRKKSSENKTIDELRQNPLDLNLASKDELETVPKIGPKKALDIIERRENKKFVSVEELAEIKGLSKSMIDKNQWRECFVIRDSST
jgi:competence protein ComEA